MLPLQPSSPRIPPACPFPPGPRRPPSLLISASLSPTAPSSWERSERRSRKHSTDRGVGRALDCVSGQGPSSRSAAKLCDLGSWSEARRRSGELPGGEGKDREAAERKKGAGGPSDGEDLDGGCGGVGVQENRRETGRRWDGRARRTGQGRFWGLKTPRPQPPRPRG